MNPELPPTWIYATLGEIGEVVAGGTPSTSDEFNFGGNIPWITPADLTGYKEKYISGGSRNLTEKGLNSSSAKLLPKGSILFSSRAPIGYVVIAKNPIATNQGFKNLILSDKIFNEYIYYYLLGNKQLVEQYASGTTFLEVSAARFKQVPIPIAPLGEQRRIVSRIEQLFTQIDEGVRYLQQAQTQLEQYKQATLQSAFKEIPEKQPLLSLLREPLKNGKSAKPTDGISGIPVMKLTAVTDKSFTEKNIKKCNLQETEVKDLWVKNEDIFIERSNTPDLVGSAAIYLGPDGLFIFPDLLIRIRIDKSKANPKYVSYFLDSPSARKYFKESAKGTSNSMPKLSQKPIEAISIPLPDLPTQAIIVKQLENNDAILNYLQDELNKEHTRSMLLKQSILHSAFNGKLVGQNLLEESASELLEKIKTARSTSKMPHGQRRLF